MRSVLFCIPITLFLLAPTLVFAAGEGIVTCTGVKLENDAATIACGTCEFASTMKNLFQTLLTIFTIVATIAFVYVGLRLVVSAGDVEAKEQAKTALKNVLIGFLLVIAAAAIVDAVLRAILPAASPLLNWRNDIQCINAIVPDNIAAPFEQAGANGLAASLPNVPGVDLCNTNYLGKYFPGQEKVASCVLQGESSCGSKFYSSTDVHRTITGAKIPFSVSPWQINLTVHEIRAGECNSGPLDCKAAYNGKDFSAQLIDRELYNKCVEALRDKDCSGTIAKRIQQKGWTQWSAYKAKGCGG